MNRTKYEMCLSDICDEQSKGMEKIGDLHNPENAEQIASLLDKSAKNIRELVTVYNLENKKGN